MFSYAQLVSLDTPWCRVTAYPTLSVGNTPNMFQLPVRLNGHLAVVRASKVTTSPPM